MFLVSLAILLAVHTVKSNTLKRSEGSGEEDVNLRQFYLETTKADDGNGKAHLSLCCPVDTFLSGDDCIEGANETEVAMPIIYEANLDSTNITANDEYFHFVVWNPCTVGIRYALNPHYYFDEEWYLLLNGSILRPLAEKAEDRLLTYRQYCLSKVKNYEYEEYLVFFCEETYLPEMNSDVIYSFGIITSVPFLLATYIVYWLLPELKNLHGLTLRGYVGCLAMAYGMLAWVLLTPQDRISYSFCILIGTFKAQLLL